MQGRVAERTCVQGSKSLRLIKTCPCSASGQVAVASYCGSKVLNWNATCHFKGPVFFSLLLLLIFFVHWETIPWLKVKFFYFPPTELFKTTEGWPISSLCHWDQARDLVSHNTTTWAWDYWTISRKGKSKVGSCTSLVQLHHEWNRPFFHRCW